jgi:hypothetical protein
LEKIVLHSNKWSFCSIYPIRESPVSIGFPSIRTDPSDALSNPQIKESKVDFPHPDGPTTARNSPAETENDIFERAFVSPSIEW